MKRSIIDLWVGIFVAIGLASVTFLALKVANLTPQSNNNSYTLIAEFDNIGGLKVKAPVKSSGVVVGRVSNIELDTQRYVARATLTLDGQYHFSRDTSAEILTAGLLGEQYVGLVQGGEEENLKPGDRLQLTSSALVLEQLIGKFMTSFAEGNNKAAAADAAAAETAP
ncbi:ABC transporter substrate-binding protein [Vogesella sp. EB]|jgi:phospholipid/cholesterol/gamma-HCH transport system substrate-binding protein|uniref:Phospholipid/cholesterol/gamma-HCH transport system substrate-binding protein n=1 Tax=Vogesella indigofera TaxID=45465 RepID=A0A495BDI4_VOGIN|nr:MULTISPECIES: outer membrane lipid asymmetry maintenance protein MlaD [Vogesella]KMJ53540.1 ABC transporter substrate-binding protein [Vogesella sp. EB]MDC7697692.1 outer membrane lipid asymmetry maintenance protein MlaD [Vogesella indigofera]RKQ58790.1 phospholipid/cholesterol/gamma-HCH transport system substrate-binding protein [Vogesella indigofera]